MSLSCHITCLSPCPLLYHHSEPFLPLSTVTILSKFGKWPRIRWCGHSPLPTCHLASRQCPQTTTSLCYTECSNRTSSFLTCSPVSCIADPAAQANRLFDSSHFVATANSSCLEIVTSMWSSGTWT